jgi:hypothetical protein
VLVSLRYLEMNADPISLLSKYQDEPDLGPVAKEALRFIEGAQCKFLQSPGPGQSSLSVVRMYEIRKALKKFQRSAFIGLEESIESLRRRDIRVHLCAIETEKGAISLWLIDESSPPVGIVVAKFDS